MPEDKKKKRKELPKDVEGALKDIFRDCELEDDYIRQLQVKQWKKLEEYWHGIQFLFWSEILQDWATPQQGIQVGIVGEETREAVGPFYDYVVNIYKAHGESIISALSQGVPLPEFFPDDADDPADLSAAQAKSKLAIIFNKHVKAKLRIIEALFKLYNQGVVFSYRYRQADKKYGTHKVKKLSKEVIQGKKLVCPECGQEIQQPPDPNQIPTCPQCNMQGTEEPYEEEHIKVDSIEEIPKEREQLEILGGLNVKIPYYARKLDKTCGYLIYYIEEHFAKVKDDFPEWADEIKPDAGMNRERWSRTPSSYSTAWRGGSEDRNLTTIKRCWLEPWMVEFLDETKEGTKKYIKKEFPNGIYFTIINERIVDWCDESKSKCWRLGQSGPSTFVHSDPIGAGVSPIQEMKNQLVNLTIQTIEYGIPSLFADKRVLNFDEFGNQESSPGMVTPVRKPAEFNSIGDGFYEQKLATPSKEIEVFEGRLDEDAQFVLGDYPSIYGGPSEGKSRTLGEYVQSSKRALARLALCYEYTRNWWAEQTSISVDAMIEDILKYGEPEKTVIKEKGEFDNIIVNPEDLKGSAKNLEPETSENFPLTSDQKMGLLLQLIQLNNPMVEAVVAHPENTHIITEALGMPELYIPGEAQRFKAMSIIKGLLTSPPIEGPDGETLPVEEPDPDVDDAATQVAIFKYFLASERGMQVRKKNPAGYAHCKAYLGLLTQMLAQQTMGQAGMSPPGMPPVEERMQ